MSQVAAFLADYENNYLEHEAAAARLQTYIRDGLSSKDYHIHLITSRCKSPSSAKEKIIRKSYADPADQMTDLYGVRVITYYAEQVDPISQRVREIVEIDPAKCIDKRAALIADGKFGYSSVHLVGRVPQTVNRPWLPIRGLQLEIQIRSVLDQAWAEIEHEVVYKSGVKFPASVARRFSAIAANFEILEAEFLSLRELAFDLVEDYFLALQAGQGLQETFDSARLIAAFEWLCRSGEGWRKWASRGEHVAVTPQQILHMLEDVNVTNAIQLSLALDGAEFKRACADLASLQGCSEAELSHVAVAAVLTGIGDWSALARHLPGLAESSEFLGIFGRADSSSSSLEVESAPAT
jgi:ppGpp synthetase/RelA/SpoT-type nucleotidyltranferase